MTETADCWSCGSRSELFKPRSGGNGVRCTRCRNELSHPTLTADEMVAVWNWRARKGEDFKEDI